MSLAGDFQDAALEVVSEFSADIGDSVLKVFGGSSYNATTGKNTATFADKAFPMAFVSIEDAYSYAGLKAQGFTSDYIEKHQAGLVAGASLDKEPTTSDRVLRGDTGENWAIGKVEKDMYGALYVLHIHDDSYQEEEAEDGE